VSVRKHQLNLRYKPPVQNDPMWFPFSVALVVYNLMWVFPWRICWCNESPMYLWHQWMSLHCDDVTRGPHRLQDYILFNFRSSSLLRSKA
jgi:hypothetical protein